MPPDQTPTLSASGSSLSLARYSEGLERAVGAILGDARRDIEALKAEITGQGETLKAAVEAASSSIEETLKLGRRRGRKLGLEAIGEIRSLGEAAIAGFEASAAERISSIEARAEAAEGRIASAGAMIEAEIERLRGASEDAAQGLVERGDAARVELSDEIERNLAAATASIEEGLATTRGMVEGFGKRIEADLATALATIEQERGLGTAAVAQALVDLGKSIAIARAAAGEEIAAAMTEARAEIARRFDESEGETEQARLDLGGIVGRAVADAQAEIRAALDGIDARAAATAEDCARRVREAIEAIPAPEKGDPGPMGLLAGVEPWAERIYRNGELVAHLGSTWQATRDTFREPGSIEGEGDWHLVAAKGADGKTWEYAGVYDPTKGYSAGHVVASDGGSFLKLTDDPSPFPGDGWRLIVQRGKPGKPGDPGKPGPPGPRGPAPVSAELEGDTTAVIRFEGGHEIRLDLYPMAKAIADRVLGSIAGGSR